MNDHRCQPKIAVSYLFFLYFNVMIYRYLCLVYREVNQFSFSFLWFLLLEKLNKEPANINISLKTGMFILRHLNIAIQSSLSKIIFIQYLKP